MSVVKSMVPALRAASRAAGSLITLKTRRSTLGRPGFQKLGFRSRTIWSPGRHSTRRKGPVPTALPVGEPYFAPSFWMAVGLAMPK